MFCFQPDELQSAIRVFKGHTDHCNSAACEDLGFRFAVPWVEGVRRTINWLADSGHLESSEDHPNYDRIIDAWRASGERLVQEFAE